MKKFRFLFVILALILVVGMTTGLIVRKQSGGQTVMQHSSASAPASTTPAMTGDDEPVAPEAKVFKIPVLISESLSQYFSVIEDGVEVDPIDVFEYSDPSLEQESKGGDIDDDPESYSESYVRYLVDPTCSSIEYDHNLRPASSWFYFHALRSDFSRYYIFELVENEENISSGSIDLSDYLSILIY